jgi:TonB family protein
MALYNAWKPAIKDDKAVRQIFNYSVNFPDNPVTNFDSTLHALVDYFDKNSIPTQISKEYRYRRITPVDEKGYIKQSLFFEEYKKNRWQTYMSVPVEREGMYYKFPTSAGKDSVKAAHLYARDILWTYYGSSFIFREDGTLLNERIYDGKGVVVAETEYYLNGQMKNYWQTNDMTKTMVSWYENGQIEKIVNERKNESKNIEKLVLSYWNKEGQQTVKNGTGHAILRSHYIDKILLEEGGFVNSLKNGRWSGKWSDGTLYYDETYDNGKLIGGTSVYEGKTYNYTELEVQPQFGEGMEDTYIFLGQNIRYPPEASRNGVTGKIYLSFMVCADGTTCEYEFLKRLGSGCDEEALRVVQMMSGKWKPGLDRGRKVKVKFNLPVSFIMQ